MIAKYRLSELNSAIEDVLETTFEEPVWVIAEISEMKVNQSGHCYLELIEKEDEKIIARVRATIWSWQFRFIRPYFESMSGEQLKEGLKVLVSVSVKFHGVYGLSLNINDIDPTYTLGDLARKKQQIIDQLRSEGVFDMNKEVDLPDFIQRIAIISSPTAAGYEDFVQQLENNELGFTYFHQLFPAYMQGNEAAPSIIAALEMIYQEEERFDAVVLIRGGGAQIDLDCFNDYDLALNITQFPLPVLTGIGHEKDDTIADMVAHTKLKTPTAVAEFIIGLSENAWGELEMLEERLKMASSEIMNKNTVRINNMVGRIKPLVRANMEMHQAAVKVYGVKVNTGVKSILNQKTLLLENFEQKLKLNVAMVWNKNQEIQHRISDRMHSSSKFKTDRAFEDVEKLKEQLKKVVVQSLLRKEQTLQWNEKNIQLLSPDHILKRGFSITLKDGKVLKSAQKLKEGDEIETVLYKGKVKSRVEK